jgi:hypothetical protein
MVGPGKMKTTLFIIISVVPVIALADDPLPKRPDFNRYQAMLNRSPFAIATVAVPTETPNFAKDLYVANAAHSGDGDLVTIASATDKNFKEYLSTKGPANDHGFAISDIQWSDKVGQTKVIITKDGKYATLTFNQALLSQFPQNPNQPQTNALQPQPPLFPPGMPQPPQPYVKPAPIPSLPPTYQQGRPQPGQIHQRGVIQRNPTPVPPTPNVPPPDDSEE